MSGLEIGDLVVCVDVLPFPEQHPRLVNALRQLKFGEVYRIRGFGQADGGPLLVGVVAGAEHNGYGWLRERFRKIQKADDAFTAQMRAFKPVKQQA